MELLAQILKIIFSKILTKLSNEEFKIWKLLIKIKLLLMLKLISFSNPFGMTFILRD